MNPVLIQIKNVGLVPVIKLDDPEKAVPLAKALKKGGVPVAEVTFRTSDAEKSIENIAREMPDIILGAGTVITVEQVKKAVAAGAKYIISPGFDSEVVSYCLDNNIPITPGCSNASEVSRAVKMGLDAVKFFPAEAAGGIKVLKALAGPFANMSYIPTGGIGPTNLAEYMSFPKVLACGGSWMVPDNLVNACDWDGIANLAREAVINMLEAKVKEMSLSDKDTGNTVAVLANLLGKGISTGSSKGSVTIGVSNVDRAVHFMQTQGVSFDENSRISDKNGNTVQINLNSQINGFEITFINN